MSKSLSDAEIRGILGLVKDENYIVFDASDKESDHVRNHQDM